MDAAKFRNYFESIEDFFTFDNWISWSEKFSDIGDANNETESGRMFNLSFQMVTSRRQDIIKREINMLESTPEERLYLLALGYFKTKDYATSQLLLEQCLLIAHGWEKAVSLRRIVDERVVHHGLIGIGITAFAAGLFVGGLAAFVRDFAATLAKKN
ncbi:hypothetical protein P8452_46815 [Trifolium repens]|nr:hypothetical protein P8452_46815 [Trifolium repens]